MLRKTSVPQGDSASVATSSNSSTGVVPSRLCDWKLSENGETFAYGGDEVDLSVWDTERAFQPQQKESSTDSSTSSKKRKRNDLFPAEIWRARNVLVFFMSMFRLIDVIQHTTALERRSQPSPTNSHYRSYLLVLIFWPSSNDRNSIR